MLPTVYKLNALKVKRELIVKEITRARYTPLTPEYKIMLVKRIKEYQKQLNKFKGTK